MSSTDFFWQHPDAAALHRRFVDAYSATRLDRVRVLAARAGIDCTGFWNDKLPAEEVWTLTLEAGQAQGRLQRLIELVLEDGSVAAHHTEIRRLSAGLRSGAAGGLGAGTPAQSAASVVNARGDGAGEVSPALPPAYAELRRLLLTGGLAADLPEGLTKQVDDARPAVADWLSYRLACVARWRRPTEDRSIDMRFTRLTLMMDQGESAQGERWRESPETFTDLRDILAHLAGVHPALVLLGEPGAGKTTLLKRLELDLAMSALTTADAGAAAQVPVTCYLPLNLYRQRDLSPRAWLAQRWSSTWPRLEGLESLLTRGQPVLLLLDALNELPHSGQEDYQTRLKTWRHELTAWTAERPSLTLVFTCRSLDYSAPLSGNNLVVPQARVNPLDNTEVQAFLDHYLPPSQAKAVWRQLEQNPRLLDLFRTPYFLRLLTRQVADDGSIPPNRAALFTGFVRQALKRDLRAEHALLAEGDLLTKADRTRAQSGRPWPTPQALPEEGPLFRCLAQLAFRMQEQAATGADSQLRVTWREALQLLPERREDLLDAGAALGILDTDGELRQTVAFNHQLLQEYFAARQLALAPDAGRVLSPWRADAVAESLPDTIARLPDYEPLPALPSTGWEETCLLTAEMLPPQATEDFVRALMSANLPLAGRAAASPALRLPASLQDSIQQALIGRSQDEAADLRARIAAGLVLGTLNDPRFEHREGPQGAYLLPPLVAIPAGTYRIGSEEPGSWRHEQPVHPVSLPAYRIGRFPVTNAEYACFIHAGGYGTERWWDTPEALAWLRGDEASAAASRQRSFEFISSIPKDDADFDKWCAGLANMTSVDKEEMDRLRHMDDDRLREMIAGWYCAEPQSQPRYWNNSSFNNPAQPIVGVSWYEARAYCNWLAAQTGLPISLPSEPQWEAAARGGQGRRYAFKGAFAAAKANTFESHVRRTTPVGVYPLGRTLEGIDDLSGNVWEWTRSLYDDPNTGEPFPYPYNPDDGREEPRAPFRAARVLRGGSWDSVHDDARASYRIRLYPDLRNYFVGFRIVVASPNSPGVLAAGAA